MKFFISHCLEQFLIKDILNVTSRKTKSIWAVAFKRKTSNFELLRVTPECPTTRLGNSTWNNFLVPSFLKNHNEFIIYIWRHDLQPWEHPDSPQLQFQELHLSKNKLNFLRFFEKITKNVISKTTRISHIWLVIFGRKICNSWEYTDRVSF